MIRIAIFLTHMALICSCSTSATQSQGKPNGVSQSQKEELKQADISLGAMLDLARSSYLKGCVDGKRHFVNKRVNTFNKCVDMAKEHELEIKSIFDL